MHALESVFGTQQHVLWWQECLRACVIFVYGLALLRITGRRTFGRWSALDIVVSIVFGSSLSRALTGNAPFGGTMIGMAVLLFLHWMLSRAVVRSPRVSSALEGSPIELARAGDRNDEAMRGSAVSRADLSEALHQAGIEHVADARLVVLEPSGRITVMKQSGG